MYQVPRGTRDFSPEEMQKMRYAEEKIRRTFQSFGYKEVQTPTFESLELFKAKSGERILDEIYAFKDKSGRELALRPELTAPVIRFYVEKLQTEPKPLKLFYFGNCFRYDRPQKGRYREFRQAGCELIGAGTIEAYAELIALAYKIFENLGLKKIELNIGNLDILSAIFKKIDLSKEGQKYLLPLIDKSMFEDILDAMLEFNIPRNVAEGFLEILKTSDIEYLLKYFKDDPTATEEIKKLEQLKKLLEEIFNVENLKIKIGIVRGLDYYKGIVFEIEYPKLGAEKQLCGGGAYELVGLLGGKEVPTSGFAIGLDRTILALEKEGFDFPKLGLDVYIIPVNEDMVCHSLKIAQELREKGFVVDVELIRRNVTKALRYANSVNSRNVIILGPKEFEKRCVTIRNMKTGEQNIVEIKNISRFLKHINSK